MKSLLPFSLVYGAAVWLRNRAFDIGVLKSRPVGVPVISVGNLTTGGTGKTPLVEFIAGRLGGGNRRVAVVSRGYGRISRGVVVVSDGSGLCADSRAGGDEPVQIARKVPQVIVVVGEKRVDAAETAVRACNAGVILLDDGFQHRYLRRACDVVVIDARTDVITEHLLPSGRKREPLSALRRADYVVLSHADGVTDGAAWREKLRPWYAGPLAGFSHAVESIEVASPSGVHPPPGFTGRRVFAFSGIGNPAGFAETLRSAGMIVAGECAFPDHHIFSEGDIEKVLSAAGQHHAEACVTTEKDIVRLLSAPELLDRLGAGVPLWYVKIKASFVFGEQEFVSMMERVAGGKPA